MMQKSANAELRLLLEGFNKSNTVLCMVTIGYAFGVFCRGDGVFVVFDTHKKNLHSLGAKTSGGYCVGLGSPQDAADFIDNVTLDSRKTIMSLSQGQGFQSFAATTIDVTAIRLNTTETTKTTTTTITIIIIIIIITITITTTTIVGPPGGVSRRAPDIPSIFPSSKPKEFF
uniref:Uncharacterized protein n=1 Tax=Lotharella globosa TaxID=91324 RepID=A0A7S4DUI1_9EUKA